MSGFGGVRGPGAPSPVRQAGSTRGGRSSSSGFGSLVDAGFGGGSEVASPAETAPLLGIAGTLIALQEVSGQGASDEEVGRRARSIIEELQALQVDMARGQVSQERLKRLADLAEMGAPGANPRLHDLLRDVATRALVEVARYEMATQGR